MRSLSVSVAVLVVPLGACGEGSSFTGDAKLNFELCRRNGGGAGYCSCMTQTLQSSMPASSFAAIAKGGPDDIDAALTAIGAADERCKEQST